MRVSQMWANNFYYSLGLWVNSLATQNKLVEGELKFDGEYIYWDTVVTYVDTQTLRTLNVKRRHSLLALGPTDYDARHYSPYDNSRFGVFTSDRLSLDESGLPTVGTEEYWANIYDVRSDNDKQIVWYVSKEWPEEFMDVARESVREWNRAFKSALGRSDDVVVLDESIRPEGADAVADPRKNVLVYVNEFGSGQPAGLGPLLSDPRNGRVISGKAYMYKTAIESVRNSLNRVFDYLENGHRLPHDRLGFVPPQTFDPSKGNVVGTPFILDPAVAARDNGRDVGGLGTPSSNTVLGSEGIFFNNPFSDAKLFLPTIPYQEVNGISQGDSVQIPAIDMASIVKTKRASNSDSFGQSIDLMIAQAEAGLFEQENDLLLNDDMPNSKSIKEVLEEQKKLLNAELFGKYEHDFVNNPLNQGATCEYKMDVTADAAIKFILAQENWQSRRQELIDDITSKYLYGVTLHEMGHNFGFQHNFKGSLDYKNFHEGYAGARSRFDRINAARELAVTCGLTDGGDPASEATKANCESARADARFKDVTAMSNGALVALASEDTDGVLFEEFRLSSVMEYPNGIFEGRSRGLGSYDIAAIKYAYGNKMELAVCPSFEEDRYCENRRTVDIDPKEADEIWDSVREDFSKNVNSGAVINHTRREFAKVITAKLRAEGKITSGEFASEYMFCANQHMFRDAGCNIWDAGTNYQEIVDNAIKSYENRYYLGGLYRGLPYENRRLAAYSTDSRNFLLMRKMFDRFIFNIAGGYGFDSEEAGAPLAVDDHYLAVRNSYQWLIDTFKTPRVGTYFWDEERGAFVVGHSPNGENQIQVNTDAGKHLYAQYEDFGLDPEERRAIAKGTIYEKLFSLLYLSGRSMVPGSEASDEILSISYFDVQDAFFSGQETILNLFSQILTSKVVSSMPVKGNVTLNQDQSLNFDIERVLPLYANGEGDFDVPVTTENLPLMYQFFAAYNLVLNYTQDNQLRLYLDMSEIAANEPVPNSPLVLSFTPPAQPTKKIVVKNVNYVPNVGIRKSIAATIAAPAVQIEAALAPVRAVGAFAATGVATYYGFLESLGEILFQGSSTQLNDIMNNQILPAKERDVQGHWIENFLTRPNNGKATVDNLMATLINIAQQNPPTDPGAVLQMQTLISNYQAMKDLPLVDLSGLSEQQLFRILQAWLVPNAPALQAADLASSVPALDYQYLLDLSTQEPRSLVAMAIYERLGYPAVRDVGTEELYNIEDALRNLASAYATITGTSLGNGF